MGLFTKIEDIDVWKRGCKLAVRIYEQTQQGKIEKDWGLKDQIRRASVSIPSNIAEGFERESKPEFKRYLLIAKGSCGELRTQLYIIKALDYLPQTEIDYLLGECREISSMLQGLIQHLRK